MNPIEFITTAASDSPNERAHGIQEAVNNKSLKILSGPGKEWGVLSYYYDPEQRCMCLDIARKE